MQISDLHVELMARRFVSRYGQRAAEMARAMVALNSHPNNAERANEWRRIIAAIERARRQ